jgi:hypothetical protein
MYKSMHKGFILHQLFEENPDFVNRLPRMEQELCNLYIVKSFDQKNIAQLYGITQGAVSSRLKRITERLQFMKQISLNFDITQFDQTLSPLFNPFEIELLRSMLETTCQSETARRLNVLFNLTKKSNSKKYNSMNQVKVRYRFEKCLNELKKYHHPYYELFKMIKQNLYLLYEVKLPHFSR